MIDIAVDATALFRTHPTGVDRAARAWVQGLADARPDWNYKLAGWRGTANMARPLERAAASDLSVSPIPRYAYRLGELARLPVPIDVTSGVTADCWIFPDFVRLPLARRRPSITMVHDLSYLVPEQFSARMHRSYLRRQVVKALKLSVVAVPSAAIATELADRYDLPRESIHVLPLGVDPTCFRPVDEADIDDVRRRLGLDRPYLLHVGALHARKNLVRLIQAYAGLGTLAAEFDLLLVGSTNRHSAETLAAIDNYRGPGRVRHIGYVEESDLPPLYGGASLVAVPSVYEGFGLPVLEAMACARPVLTSPGGALEEVGGDVACYADARNVDALTDGLSRLLGDPDERERRGRAGLERSRSFSWGESGHILAELIEDLTAVASRPGSRAKI